MAPQIMFLLSVMVALADVGLAVKCPTNIASYRSSYVARDFNPQHLEGQWYENAYKDLAQLGSSCQTLFGSFASTGELVLDFSVNYGLPLGKPLHFTISEHYFPLATPIRGRYLKKVVIPGSDNPSDFLIVDTVFISVRGNATYYDAFAVYGCTEKLGVGVQELQIISRTPYLPSETIDDFTEEFRGLGIDVQKLTIVDRSKC